MDSFEFNKIIGAVLGTLLFVMGIGFVAEAIYAPRQGIGPGYALAEPEPAVAADESAPVVAGPSLATLLASADATRGQAAVRKCQSCHNFGEGEPSKQGPHLFGIVGRPEGGIADFAYSDGMKAHNAEGDVWTYENINTFITAPKAYVPGTKMGFAGVKSPEERADILAYLQTLSHDPVPFPTADAAAPPTDGTAPEGATAPASDAEPSAATPANATATPTETQGETPVVGTPTTSGTDAAPAAPATAPAADPAPAAPATGQDVTPAPAASEATPAPVTTGAPATP